MEISQHQISIGITWLLGKKRSSNDVENKQIDVFYKNIYI